MTEVAHTKPGHSYPGYLNLKRDGQEFVLTVRGDPKPYHGIAVCGVDCLPNGPMCNNYCNLAPGKGPMKPGPMPMDHVKCGETVAIRLTREALEAWLEDAPLVFNDTDAG